MEMFGANFTPWFPYGLLGWINNALGDDNYSPYRTYTQYLYEFKGLLRADST